MMVSVDDREVSELLGVMYRSDVRRSKVALACCNTTTTTTTTCTNNNNFQHQSNLPYNECRQ